MKIALIIPFLNEAEGLPFLMERLNKALTEIESKHNLSTSFIFVDDGSKDNSSSIIPTLDFQGRHCELITLSRNFGKEAALTAGLQHAERFDATVMIDSDLEHPPELINTMIDIWKQQSVDSVYAYKEHRKENEGKVKSALSRLFYFLINKDSKFEFVEDAGDYRLLSSKVVKALNALPENQRFLKGLYAWVGFEQVGIPFTPESRAHGETNFSPWKLALLALDGITSFTTSPLRLIMVAGSVVCFLSGIYGLYIVIERFLFTPIQPGLASVLALISFFGGLQLFCIGLIGEYIGRILSESKQRPTFIIKTHQTISSKDKQ